MQRTSQSSQTPNRRRQGGRHRNTPKSTTYASENDIPSHRPDSLGSPDAPTLETHKSLRSSSTSQKPRNNNNKKKSKKPQTKDVSQTFSKSDRTSPLLQPKDDTMPIFAGSTFHASPAPSALPIPSFFSSEVDTPPTAKAMSSPEQELSCPTTDSDETRSSSPASVLRAGDSPLELLFRADRAEKAKIRRASSSNADANTPSPFSPPYESHGSAKEYNHFPTATIPAHMRRPIVSKRSTTMGISADELDGDPSQPVGPAFSTPFHERMRAVRPSHGSSPAVLANQDTNSSDSLKRYLFTGRLARDDESAKQLSDSARQIPEQVSPQAHKRLHQPDLPRRMPRGMFPASVLTGNVRTGQSSVSPVQGNLTRYQPDQLSTMEDSLRRVLKLDSPSQSLSLH